MVTKPIFLATFYKPPSPPEFSHQQQLLPSGKVFISLSPTSGTETDLTENWLVSSVGPEGFIKHELYKTPEELLAGLREWDIENSGVNQISWIIPPFSFLRWASKKFPHFQGSFGGMIKQPSNDVYSHPLHRSTFLNLDVANLLFSWQEEMIKNSEFGLEMIVSSHDEGEFAGQTIAELYPMNDSPKQSSLNIRKKYLVYNLDDMVVAQVQYHQEYGVEIGFIQVPVQYREWEMGNRTSLLRASNKPIPWDQAFRTQLIERVFLWRFSTAETTSVKTSQPTIEHYKGIWVHSIYYGEARLSVSSPNKKDQKDSYPAIQIFTPKDLQDHLVLYEITNVWLPREYMEGYLKWEYQLLTYPSNLTGNMISKLFDWLNLPSNEKKSAKPISSGNDAHRIESANVSAKILEKALARAGEMLVEEKDSGSSKNCWGVISNRPVEFPIFKGKVYYDMRDFFSPEDVEGVKLETVRVLYLGLDEQKHRTTYRFSNTEALIQFAKEADVSFLCFQYPDWIRAFGGGGGIPNSPVRFILVNLPMIEDWFKRVVGKE